MRSYIRSYFWMGRRSKILWLFLVFWSQSVKWQFSPLYSQGKRQRQMPLISVSTWPMEKLLLPIWRLRNDKEQRLCFWWGFQSYLDGTGDLSVRTILVIGVTSIDPLDSRKLHWLRSFSWPAKLILKWLKMLNSATTPIHTTCMEVLSLCLNK
jgi:hypothetical protein